VLVTRADGCSAYDEVDLNFSPLPFVNAGTDATADCTLGIILQGEGDGEPTWSPSLDVQQPNSFITAAAPASNTVYTLTVTDDLGCSASSTVTISADCSLLLIPNIFTPNGDGDNDQFKVISRGVKEYSMQIFNRWGHLMFESNNPNEAWTGAKNGVDAAEGTYMYVVLAKDQNGKNILVDSQSRGTVTLTR
jgi:gliding motility-associated-like protein